MMINRDSRGKRDSRGGSFLTTLITNHDYHGIFAGRAQ